MRPHHHQDLIKIFNDLFEESEETILVPEGKEPLYIPKDASCSKHQIVFTHDYYSSALHEIAHWCIASKERRQLVDYGYWYEPHRESSQDQSLFEKVESKPQALEWIFSTAAGLRFFISADNLSLNNEVSLSFKQSIHQHAIHYLTVGLPKRAKLLTEQLLLFYNLKEKFSIASFSLENL